MAPGGPSIFCTAGQGLVGGAGSPGSDGIHTRVVPGQQEGVGEARVATPAPPFHCGRKEGGRAGVDTGSLRFVSRKAERALHVRLQQFFHFLLSLGLCPVPDSTDPNHQKPLASPLMPAWEPCVCPTPCAHTYTYTHRDALAFMHMHSDTHPHIPRLS